MRPAPRLQPLTRARVATLGEVGTAWTAALPGILADLEVRWSITVGRGLPGGSASYVARATTAEGGSAVVKVVVPGESLAEQAATLERAEGRGYARLLGYDGDRGAMLLESLGQALQQSARPPADQLRILADTLLLAWQDPADAGPALGFDKADSLHALISELWPRLGRPCSERVVQQALAFAERRRAPASRRTWSIVHGDPHPANLLAVHATASRRRDRLLLRRPGRLRDRPGVRPRRGAAGLVQSAGRPRRPRAAGRATASCSPTGPGSTPPGSGSGASSNGCPPACTCPPSARPPWADRSWTAPNGWSHEAGRNW